MQQLPLSIREIAQARAQITGPLHAVKLVHTDSFPAIQPPASVVIHIGSVQPSLVDLTPVSQSILLTGYKMAYLYRHVHLQEVSYMVADIWADEERPSRIMARLEREDA